MYEKIAAILDRGWGFVSKNPQIFFTASIGLIIVASFMLMSQLFVGITVDTQDRFNRNYASSVQDTFAEFAVENINNAELLNNVIKKIGKQNETIRSFKVVKIINKRNIVVSSLIPSEIGTIDEDDNIQYELSKVDATQTFTFDEEEQGERIIKAVRAIKNNDDEILGWIVSKTSLSEFDRITRTRITQAYFILFVIVAVILILLLRHARIIDYASLYKKLESVDKMKDDFISMASHELRTPLGAIRGYAEFIREANILEGQQKENLSRIEISTRQLDDLVADILDVTRLEQGRMKFSMVDINLNDFMRVTVEGFKSLSDKKGLSIAFEAGEVQTLYTDQTRLKQIVTNLVGNAIKYSTKGEVKARTYKENDRIYIRVSDTGIGMTGEEQRNLFQKFYRIRTEETSDIRGTGLGLWITKQLVENMGGTITVESIKGVGSHFIISFPA